MIVFENFRQLGQRFQFESRPKGEPLAPLAKTVDPDGTEAEGCGTGNIPGVCGQAFTS